MLRICVLIPVYNESKNIGGVVRSLRERKLDVFVVDDGSTDDSGRIAREAGAFVLRNQVKSGKGFSLRQGFEHILKKGYEGVITMDGDGQHSVGDISEFLRLAQSHDGVVVGNRMSDSIGMPLVRKITNKVMSWMISLACRQRVPDTQCGYRYVSAEVLQCVRLKCNGFEIETEIIMKASKTGFRIISVPIETIYRDEVSHIRPLHDTQKFFNYFFKEIFSRDQ